MSSVQASEKIAPEVLATKIMETVPLVMHFLRRNFHQHSKSSLSLPQVRTLAFLKREPGTSLSMLSDWLGVTNATASNIVEKLVRLKLVKRSDDPRERRRITLNLTAEGEQNLLSARKFAMDSMTSLLLNVPKDQLIAVYDGLSSLKEIFVDRH